MLVSMSLEKVKCIPPVLIMQEAEWSECAAQWIMHFSPPGSRYLPYHTEIHYVEQTFYLYNKLQNYSTDQLQVGRQGNGTSQVLQTSVSLCHSFLCTSHALVWLLLTTKGRVLITDAGTLFSWESVPRWKQLPPGHMEELSFAALK